MAQYNLGRFLPIFKGQYSSSIQYLPLDIVYYGGSSYVCKSTSRNHVPTNTTYWQIVALKGELSGTLTPAQTAAIISQIESDTSWVSDSQYVHTDNNFSDTYKSAVDNIGNGTITIRKNNVSVGSFSTNSNQNTAINITVPTTIDELTGGIEIWRAPELISIDDTDYNIPVLYSNKVYYFNSPLTKLVIESIEDPNPEKSYTYQPTYIDFTVGSGFVYDDNGIFKYLDEIPVEWQEGIRYRLTYYGGAIKVNTII